MAMIVRVHTTVAIGIMTIVYPDISLGDYVDCSLLLYALG